ncbi:MAG: hypothetical protein KIT84_11000 [Labilithrix sp.]|nr:hypothetical protein [Labilithrix sp.]MCW5811535.1 hypothetical protein [Labilithrix sp.]
MAMSADADTLKHHLGAAVEAAARKELREYLVHIAASHALDGLTRQLQNAWPHALPGVIEEAVSTASDELYVRAGSGPIVAPLGFLWGTARNIMLKKHRGGTAVTESLDDESNADLLVWNAEETRTDKERAALRDAAIRFARSVLPSLGHANVVQVMTFIIDCVDRGDVYVDNPTIGAALGLTSDTVKRCKHRGFERLAREAKKRGMNIDDVLEDVTDEEDDDVVVEEE